MTKYSQLALYSIVKGVKKEILHHYLSMVVLVRMHVGMQTVLSIIQYIAKIKVSLSVCG